MVYPENIEAKLGFDQIREILKNECLSTLGQLCRFKIYFRLGSQNLYTWILGHKIRPLHYVISLIRKITWS